MGWNYLSILKLQQCNCWSLGMDKQGSDQFMNWIGIDNQFNSIQDELNWNWIEWFWIGIELELKAWTDRNWSIQSIHFQFNSLSYNVNHFLYAILWKFQCAKQSHVSKHTHMLHCMGSAGVFGHKGLTIISITLRYYFQWFNLLVIESWWPAKIINSLVPCDVTLYKIIVYW